MKLYMIQSEILICSYCLGGSARATLHENCTASQKILTRGRSIVLHFQ